MLLSWTNKLISTPDNKSTERSIRQVRQCIGIALECVDPSMEKRPTAKDILEMLNGLDKVRLHTYISSIYHVIAHGLNVYEGT